MHENTVCQSCSEQGSHSDWTHIQSQASSTQGEYFQFLHLPAIEIDVKNLPEGLYILSVICKEGVYNQKVSVVH